MEEGKETAETLLSPNVFILTDLPTGEKSKSAILVVMKETFKRVDILLWFWHSGVLRNTSDLEVIRDKKIVHINCV